MPTIFNTLTHDIVVRPLLVNDTLFKLGSVVKTRSIIYLLFSSAVRWLSSMPHENRKMNCLILCSMASTCLNVLPGKAHYKYKFLNGVNGYCVR